MRRVLCIAACLLPGLAWAQEDDRDFLTAFLEDSLSDAGRQVTVTGFAGALSSRATMDQLTIADDKGVWITLNGVVLDWSRSALLSGELNVSELSAQEIIIARLPETKDGTPSPEASGFSLPDLPVSVHIDRVAAERIELGPEVLGQPVTGTLDASVQLAGGEGQDLSPPAASAACIARSRPNAKPISPAVRQPMKPFSPSGACNFVLPRSDPSLAWISVAAVPLTSQSFTFS